MGAQQWQARATLGRVWQWHNWQSVAFGVASVAILTCMEAN